MLAFSTVMKYVRRRSKGHKIRDSKVAIPVAEHIFRILLSFIFEFFSKNTGIPMIKGYRYIFFTRTRPRFGVDPA